MCVCLYMCVCVCVYADDGDTGSGEGGTLGLVLTIVFPLVGVALVVLLAWLRTSFLNSARRYVSYVYVCHVRMNENVCVFV